VEKTVVITQSNYLPWRGYFDLLRSADDVVLLDSVQYTRRDWRNRNQIKTAQGAAWLTIPVAVKGKYFQAIDETHIAGRDWVRRHRNAIESAYRNAACFEQIAPWLFGLLDGLAAEQLLSVVNERTIRAVCDRVGIGVRIQRCTDILSREKLRELEANARLIALAKELNATRYLSGPAARAYLNIDQFHAEGLEVAWMDYEGYQPYPQLWNGFLSRVSIVDLLLNTGPEAPKYLAKAMR
jgi:hypothetical protein